MYFSILVIQGVIPLALLLWQGLSRSWCRLGWLLKTILVAVYLGGITLAGLWSVFFPWWTPYLYGLAWTVLSLFTWRRVREQSHWPKRNIFGVSRIIICGVLTGLFGILTLHAAMGYSPSSAEPASLAFPLKDGSYHVLNGGSQVLVNS
ncbi:MAG: hypothetical protein AAF329_28505, partial [Cyanobacteria bacterium P01_A01_bin.17]